jgi:hypothetical protein
MSSPMAMQTTNIEEPPWLIKGKVRPLVGSKPVLTAA